MCNNVVTATELQDHPIPARHYEDIFPSYRLHRTFYKKRKQKKVNALNIRSSPYFAQNGMGPIGVAALLFFFIIRF